MEPLLSFLDNNFEILARMLSDVRTFTLFFLFSASFSLFFSFFFPWVSYFGISTSYKPILVQDVFVHVIGRLWDLVISITQRLLFPALVFPRNLCQTRFLTSNRLLGSSICWINPLLFVYHRQTPQQQSNLQQWHPITLVFCSMHSML